VFNQRCPGQVFDAETGLFHNGYRDYDPSVGRYLEPDPLGLAGGLHLYTYAANDPLSHADPTGLFVDEGGAYLAPLVVVAGVAAAATAPAWAVPVAIGTAIVAVGSAIYLTMASDSEAAAVPSPSPPPAPRQSDDTLRPPERSERGGARCRCKAPTNGEGGRGPSPQEWFFAERTGATVAEAAKAACRQVNVHIGIAYPGCQGEHCHCVCSRNGGPPFPYNPK
jgi:RHS repeat-associated protein